jgi:hypothetical protein
MIDRSLLVYCRDGFAETVEVDKARRAGLGRRVAHLGWGVETLAAVVVVAVQPTHFTASGIGYAALMPLVVGTLKASDGRRAEARPAGHLL